MRPVYPKHVLQKLVVLLLAMASVAWAAAPQFSGQKRIGLTTGDQWEPAVAADGSGHIYALYPQYGRVPNCDDCSVPTMLLVVSNDNGKTWQAPRVMLAAGSGQFDAQIAVDPADRHTVFAAWLENKKREVILAKSSRLRRELVFHYRRPQRRRTRQARPRCPRPKRLRGLQSRRRSLGRSLAGWRPQLYAVARQRR